MAIFLCFLLLILYFILRSNPDRRKAQRIYIYTITIVLCLFSALRNLAVGNDTYAYYMTYENVGYSSWTEIFSNFFHDYFHASNEAKDPGYAVVQKLFQSISKNFGVFQFFVALLFISAIGRLIYKNIDSLSGYVLSYGFYISLFYHYLPNSSTRQTVAMGLLLWGIILWIEKKMRLIPIIIILLASTIHKSSLLGLIPLCLSGIKNVKYLFVSALFLCPIVFFTGRNVALFLASMSGSEQYVDYATSTYYGEAGKPIMYIIEMFLFYIIGLFQISNISCKMVTSYGRYAILNFSIAISIISFIWIDPSLMRIIAYYSLWGIIYLPIILREYARSIRISLYTIVLVFTLGRMVVQPIPYKFYWQAMQLHERFE